MKKVISLLIILTPIVFSCGLFDENDDPAYSPESSSSRIDLPSGKSSSSTEWLFCESVEIDLSKYKSIDSIVFVPNLRSQLIEEHCIAQLYDFSSDRAIVISEVASIIDYTLHNVRSGDIRITMRQDKHRVGMRFRSSKTGHHVEVGPGSHLLIYHRQ